MRKLSKAGQERIITIVSPIALLAVWQLCSNLEYIDARYVPSPLLIFQNALQLLASGELTKDISASLYRLAVGFVIGAIPGICIGMIMGLSRIVRAALDPIVSAIYPIPKIAILPLLMLIFGIGDGSKIAAVAISVGLLMIINTMAGVMHIDRVYFDVASNFKAPWHKKFLRVVLPATLPTIFSGLRIALGVALIVLVGAEFVASNIGIGYLIWSSWQTLVIEQMYVGIIVITILGVLSVFLLKEAERYLMPWRNL